MTRQIINILFTFGISLLNGYALWMVIKSQFSYFYSLIYDKSEYPTLLTFGNSRSICDGPVYGRTESPGIALLFVLVDCMITFFFNTLALIDCMAGQNVQTLFTFCICISW